MRRIWLVAVLSFLALAYTVLVYRAAHAQGFDPSLYQQYGPTYSLLPPPSSVAPAPAAPAAAPPPAPAAPAAAPPKKGIDEEGRD